MLGRFGVLLDAVGTLSNVCDGDGNQLLCPGIQSTICEHLASEGPERGLDIEREVPALAGCLRRRLRV
jgi:hypothetical protein